jgi:hypothetical protein
MIQSAAYEIIKEEGWQGGRTEGEAKGLAEATLEALAIRFDPTLTNYRRLEKRVLALTDLERLRGLHRAAILAQDVAEFERALAE